MKNLTNFLIAGIIFVILLVSNLIGLSYLDANKRPLAISNDIIIKVPEGATTKHFWRQLKDRNILNITHRLYAYWYLRAYWDKVKYGTYSISPNDTLSDLIDKLVKGETLTMLLRLPAGVTFFEWLAILEKAPFLEKTLGSLSIDEIKKQFNAISLEATFLPDSYKYDAGTKDVQILHKAKSAMDKMVSKIWEQKDESLPYKSPLELIIMASIIEKETGTSEEKPLIASVFINRLAKDMKLESDVTSKYEARLKKQGMLKDNEKYDTYKIKGLPPLPIAVPSISSLEAAAHPSKSNYLFFVSNCNKSHNFSVEYSDHLKAVQNYRKCKKVNKNNDL